VAGKRSNGEGSIFKRADGRWAAKLTIGVDTLGKQKTRTVYGKTQTDVREKLRKLQRAHEDQALTPPNKMTVDDLMTQWLASKVSDVAARSHELYAYEIKQYISPILGRVPLQTLAPLQIERMKQAVIQKIKDNHVEATRKRLEDGKPPLKRDPDGMRTATGVRRTLWSALEQAVAWQLIPKNPCSAVKPPKLEEREIKMWEADEMTSFLETAQSHRLYALFYLALSTGLRQGELLALKWTDVLLEEGRSGVHVRLNVSRVSNKGVLKAPKTKKARRFVAVAEDSRQVLLAHRERQEAEVETVPGWIDQNLVFPNVGGELILRENLNRIWRNLRSAAAVSEIAFHDMRHIHASMCVRAGMDIRMLSDRMGHTTVGFTLQRYTHLFAEQKQASISLSDLMKKKA
jgi:integrase